MTPTQQPTDTMSKQDRYACVLKQIAAVISDEQDMIANMANTAAILHQSFGFWWTGFYIVRGEELVLGPFQGPVACTRIKKGKGVCGTAWERKQTVVVPNVHLFKGHIACSSESQSEIVVPLSVENKVTAVLDIDSRHLDTFDDTDRQWLERITQLIMQ